MRRARSGRPWFTAWAMAVYAFLYLPILIMAIFAFDKPSAQALSDFHGSNFCTLPPDQIGNITVWNGFTTCWFSAGLHDPTFVPAILTSLQIAAVAAIVATVPRAVRGAGAGAHAAQVPGPVRRPGVPDAGRARDRDRGGVPDLLRPGEELRSGVPGLGRGTILLGQVVFNASLATLIIRARFVGMGDTLEEAAYDLGSSPLSTFRQVTLPRLMPAIVAAALLSFTFSFDDYVLPAFTNGTTNTWPIVLYSAVRFGITPAVNALATIMLTVTALAVVITAVVLRRGRVRAGPGQEQTRSLSAALGVG